MSTRLYSILTTAVLLLAILLPPLARAQNASQQLAAASVLGTIKKRGAIRVGLSTFVPWAMRNKNGELIGYEIDVAKQLAEDMKGQVEFVPTAWDGIIPALLAGKFDVVIGGMSITPERNLTVIFTQPYANSGIHLVANKELAAGFKSLEDFNKPDVVLAVRRGATPATVAKRLMPKATLRQFDEDVDQVQEVLNGKLVKRGVDLRCLDVADKAEKVSGNKVKRQVTVKNGIESEQAKKIVKLIKDSKLKVTASIQGEAVRVSGAKRDVLQEVMALMRKEIAGDMENGFPLQFNNFRD